MKLKNIVRAVAPIAAVFAPIIAPTVFSGVLGGALLGGATAAISGGDILKGAVTGGIGGAVSSGLQGALGSQAVGEFSGAAVQPGAIEATFPGLSPASTASLARGLSTAGGSLASQLAGGAPLPQALKQAGATGISGGISEYLYGTPTSASESAAKQATTTGLQRLLSPATQYVGTTTRPDSTVGGVGTGQTASQAPGPGSAALAQALRTDPGAPLFGTDSEGRQRKVWNVESLKLKDETGA